MTFHFTQSEFYERDRKNRKKIEYFFTYSFKMLNFKNESKFQFYLIFVSIGKSFIAHILKE